MATYINSLSIKKGNYGLKMSGHIDKIIEELRQHANEKGYVNLEIKERKEPSQYGHTHSITVDEWKPSESRGF